MELVQGLQLSTPLLASSLLFPLSKNSSNLITKLPTHTTTSRHQVLASLHSTTIPKREKDAKKRVVITGMGVVSVLGNDVDMFYQRLLDGESGIGLIDRFDTSELTTRFAGQIHGFNSNGYIDAKYDMRLDNCQRYCIVAGKKAIEDAALNGHECSKIDKERAGVLVGSAIGGATCFSNAVESLIKRGPNCSMSAACATSNACFCAAATHIREGKADLIIAGGTDAFVTPIGLGAYAACRALSRRNDDPKTASRPWDKDRDGFVMGEGAGVLVMESLEHAMKRDSPILAEYLGGAVNCDAYHITNPQLDGFGLTKCIQNSLEDASVFVEEVNYINAHATSTMVGDLAELSALNKVFKNTKGIKMNGTKSMIGHSLGAAGGLEAIATIKAIQTGLLHPTINQFDPESEVQFDTVANIKQQHEINVAISNSFGLGGHNSVVAFSAFKQ